MNHDAGENRLLVPHDHSAFSTGDSPDGHVLSKDRRWHYLQQLKVGGAAGFKYSIRMKTQYYTASTLDGYIADHTQSLDWLFQFGAADETDYPAFLREVGAIAMGSTTYDWLWNRHLAPEAAEPQPWPYVIPTWVFTHRKLPKPPDANVRFVRGDVQLVHAEMKAIAAGKNIWIVGGGDLAGQFYDHGLLDEVLITYAPVMLGSGAPLFPRRIEKPPLRIIEVRRFGPSFVQLRCEIAKG